MQRTVIILAYFFFILAESSNCFSQSKTSAGQYPFVHYTPKDGLINSRVRKAYQDSKGRMYFLTFGGISVFDGARFKNYTMQDGLGSSLVNDILEVGDDSLLIASNNGIYLNVLVKGKIGKFNTGGPAIPVINQFYRHENGKLYLCSDNGLFVLEKNKIVPLNVSPLIDIHSRASFRSLTGTGNWLLAETSEMNTVEGLYLFDIANNRFSDAIQKKIYLLGKDHSGFIWVWASDQLMLIDNSALVKGKLLLTALPSRYSEMKKNSTINLGFGKDCIWMMFKNKELKNAGILRLSVNGSIVRMPLAGKAQSSVFGNIFPDKENNIWICNDGEGVFKLVNSPLQIYEEPLGNLNGYLDDAFHANGVSWFSTNTNSLFRNNWEPADQFRCNMNFAPEIFYEQGKKILAHASHDIYEGKLNTANKTISFHPVISLPDSDYFIRKILVDPYGNIISTQRRGLFVWKKHKRIFYSPVEYPDSYDDLAFDKKGRLWAIARYSGITVFKIHPENVSHYLQPVSNFSKDQLKGSPRCFVMDKNGLLWIGTRDDGLFCFYQENDRLIMLHHVNSVNGLTDNFVTALACDSFNNIIVGTQTGLDRILREGENPIRIENLSKNSNFFAQIMQCWADKKQAYARSFAGAILQINSLPFEKIHNNPRLLLEEIKVNAQTTVAGKNTFSWKENNLSILVAAPSFIDEKQVTYSYLLEGSGNKQWSDTSTSNAVINLTNLSAGNYLLKVKAFFPSGFYEPAALSYSFVIAPPWWRTWWFAILLAVSVIAILVTSFRFYYRTKLEKQKALLEKQQAVEKERTRIATDMHDDLGAGLSRIKFLSETIGIKKQQHQPIEEDISKIRQYSHEMIDKMGEIVWALNERNDSLSDLLSYSRSYAVEYLSQSGIECEVKAPENFPIIFLSGEFRRNIYLVLKEALHNIVKHAQANHVRIRIDVDPALMITIKDDGVGFDKNKLRPFSNGLSNMEKRMKDIGGNIAIKNDDGTIVILSAPLTS